MLFSGEQYEIRDGKRQSTALLHDRWIGRQADHSPPSELGGLPAFHDPLGQWCRDPVRLSEELLALDKTRPVRRASLERAPGRIDQRPGFTERQRDALTDASRCARHHGHLTLKRPVAPSEIWLGKRTPGVWRRVLFRNSYPIPSSSRGMVDRRKVSQTRYPTCLSSRPVAQVLRCHRRGLLSCATSLMARLAALDAPRPNWCR